MDRDPIRRRSIPCSIPTSPRAAMEQDLALRLSSGLRSHTAGSQVTLRASRAVQYSGLTRFAAVDVSERINASTRLPISDPATLAEYLNAEFPVRWAFVVDIINEYYQRDSPKRWQNRHPSRAKKHTGFSRDRRHRARTGTGRRNRRQRTLRKIIQCQKCGDGSAREK